MKLDILKQVFSPSMEEVATGVAAPEQEHVIYGRMVDLQQLSRASHMEKQEQWEIKVPKTDENATRGTVRARRTEIEGQPVEFTACVKTPMGDQSNPIARNEVVVPCTEDFFEVLKKMAGSGMVKHRYFFPITSGIDGSSDTAVVQDVELSQNVPGVVPEEAPDASINSAPESAGATPNESAADGDVGGEVVSTEGDTDKAHAEGDRWVMPLKDAVSEHKDLVKTLKTPTKSDDKKEIKEQGHELKKMTAAEKKISTESDDINTKVGQPFVKQAVTIHAIKWTGKNIAEVQAFMNDGDVASFSEITDDDGVEDTDGELYIGTLEDGAEKDAKHVASPGDWIIRGVQGEFYPCKPDIFIQTYSPVAAVSMEEDEPVFNDGVAVELTPVDTDAAGEPIVQEQASQPASTSPDANPLQSPESTAQQYWEVDVFIKDDGTYYDYVKIDLEVSDMNAPLPPLPVQLTEMVTAPYGQRTPEEEAMVTNLYDTVFRTRNPGAVPVSAEPTPQFEKTALVEDGTPAEGTPETSDGVGDSPNSQTEFQDGVATSLTEVPDDVETDEPAPDFKDGVATSVTEIDEDGGTETIPTEPDEGNTEEQETASKEAEDLPVT